MRSLGLWSYIGEVRSTAEGDLGWIHSPELIRLFTLATCTGTNGSGSLYRHLHFLAATLGYNRQRRQVSTPAGKPDMCPDCGRRWGPSADAPAPQFVLDSHCGIQSRAVPASSRKSGLSPRASVRIQYVHVSPIFDAKLSVCCMEADSMNRAGSLPRYSCTYTVLSVFGG